MWKTSILPITILVLAGVCLVLGILGPQKYVVLFNILSFALSTFVAIYEIIRARKSDEQLKEMFSKRPATEVLTQDEYNTLKSQGKIVEDTIYMTYEE